MNQSDAQAIEKLIQELDTPGAPHWTLEQIVSELGAGHSLGLRDSNALLAFILYTQPAPDTFEINYLACSKLLQRTGLMTQLFLEFLKRIRELAASDHEVWLEVHEKNLVAMQFYQKFAFEKLGTRQNYYSDKGSAVLYSLKITC